MVTQKERKVTSMAQRNYAAWHIDPKSYSDTWSADKKLRFFARYAVLSPSGHNTQPWHFQFEGDHLVLQVNPARELPFSGTLAAEPYVSLGACLETLRLAAQSFGHRLNIDYLFGETGMVRVGLGKRLPADPSLSEAITHRTSNRSLYKQEQLAEDVLHKVAEHDFTHVAVSVIQDRAAVDFLAKMTLEATVEIMTEQAFRAELSKWVRNNITRQHDGMPGFAQGMPTPPSLIAKHVVQRFDISKTQAKLDAKRVEHSPALLLILTREDSPVAYLEAGRLYARICILAQQQGLATSGVGAGVISPTTKKLIAEYFKLDSTPTAMIRIGQATKVARHTPRWPLEKVSN